MSKCFSRYNLQFTFIKDIYISIFMRILTDFRKALETGIDPVWIRYGSGMDPRLDFNLEWLFLF